jgi:hypothetical protein
MPTMVNPPAIRVYLDADGWRDVTPRIADAEIVIQGRLLEGSATLHYTPGTSDPPAHPGGRVRLESGGHTFVGIVAQTAKRPGEPWYVECAVRME